MVAGRGAAGRARRLHGSRRDGGVRRIPERPAAWLPGRGGPRARPLSRRRLDVAPRRQRCVCLRRRRSPPAPLCARRRPPRHPAAPRGRRRGGRGVRQRPRGRGGPPPSPSRDRRRRAPGADRHRIPPRRPHRAPRRRARPARQRPRADPGAAPADPVLVGVRAGRLAPPGPRRLRRRVAAPPAGGHRPPGRSQRGPPPLLPERGIRFPAHPARGPCRRRPLRNRDRGPAVRAPPGDDHRTRRHRRTLPGPRRRASPGAPPRPARARCRRARSSPARHPARLPGERRGPHLGRAPPGRAPALDGTTQLRRPGRGHVLQQPVLRAAADPVGPVASGRGRGGRHRPRSPRVGPRVGRPGVPSARRPPRRRPQRAARGPGPAVPLLPAGADAPRPRHPPVRDARPAHRLRVPVRRLRRDGSRLDVRPGPQGSAQAPACRPGPPLPRVHPPALVAFAARRGPAPLPGGHGLREARGAPALHGAAARHAGPGRRQPREAGALCPGPRLCRPQRVSAPAPRWGLAGGPAARSASRPGCRGLAGPHRAGPAAARPRSSTGLARAPARRRPGALGRRAGVEVRGPGGGARSRPAPRRR